jgi:hypothetical protein
MSHRNTCVTCKHNAVYPQDEPYVFCGKTVAHEIVRTKWVAREDTAQVQAVLDAFRPLAEMKKPTPEATKTLRDEFALAALTGPLRDWSMDKTMRKQIASVAYEIADAMIAAREAKR